jgi:hypothetical protein
MTKEDVIRMARRAGAVFPGDGSYHTFERIEDLEHFAFLVAAAEREACARVCEDVPAGKYDTPEFWREGVAYTCAAAIRARSQS